MAMLFMQRPMAVQASAFSAVNNVVVLWRL